MKELEKCLNVSSLPLRHHMLEAEAVVITGVERVTVSWETSPTQAISIQSRILQGNCNLDS